MTTLAWHNDPALKAEALAAMKAHREADQLMQGSYAVALKGGGYQGCFYGCLTTEKLAAEAKMTPEAWIDDMWKQVDAVEDAFPWHDEGERIWGIDAEVGSLLDNLFESLPEQDCAAFAVDAIEAIPVGADLSAVYNAHQNPDAYGAALDAAGNDNSSDAFYRVRAAGLLELCRNAPVPATTTAGV